MPAERYFFEQAFSLDSVIALEGQEFHHLTHVMRNREGDVVELVNGQGLLAKATIDRIEKKKSFLKVIEIVRADKDSFSLILAQGIPRSNRLDFILEKGTELGMSELWLFSASHSEKKEFSEHQLERMKGVLIAAMKQCGRLFLPTIKMVSPLDKWEKPSHVCFFGDTTPNAPCFAEAWKKQSPKNGVIVVIGPESGFNTREVERLKQLEAVGVSLHKNILRTDTAALVALTLADSYKTAPL